MKTPPSSAVPRGLIAAVVLLVVVIAAVLVIVTIGSDDSDSATEAVAPTTGAAGSDFPGLKVEEELTRNHATLGERIDYPDSSAHPPLGGNHALIWMNCGVYTAPVPSENAVHSLEHGAVWITYQPDLPAEQLAALTAFAQSSDRVLLSPYAQDEPVYLTAWGRQLAVQDGTDGVVQRFVDEFVDGEQSPEPGASCESPANEPGSVPFVFNSLDGTVSPSTSTETVPAQGPIS